MTSERWVRKCLPDEYKQTRKRNKGTEQDAELSSANAGNNVPEQEQTAMTVDTEGYEEAFEVTGRGPNVRSAAEFEFDY